MQIEKLNKLETWFYLPTMESLKFFDADGNKAAEWLLNCSPGRCRWSFYCVFNTLPKELGYNQILVWWKVHVGSRLREAYGA